MAWRRPGFRTVRPGLETRLSLLQELGVDGADALVEQQDLPGLMLVTTPMASRTACPSSRCAAGIERCSPNSVNSAISSTLASICLRVWDRGTDRG